METLGRRERKKRQTAASIEWATLELACVRGLSGTTIEAISDRADVTSRTFFNYFASKEDAALGIRKGTSDGFVLPVPRQGVSAYDQAHDHIRRLLAELGEQDAQLASMRRMVQHLNPELIPREYANLTAASERFTLWVSSILDSTDSLGSDAARTARATAIIHVLGAAYNIAARDWSSGLSTTRTLAEHFDVAVSEIAQVVTGIDS
ncbi:TetR/AcrR family transcriptional regulator [Cryobacterium sp. AP23]